MGSARLFFICGSLGLVSIAANAGETVLYTYDEFGRLIKTQQSGTVNNGVDTDIDYDDAGNRSSYAVIGSTGAGTDSGATGTPGSGSGETPPSFSVTPESEDEGTPIVFTITKSAATNSIYTVNWETEEVPGSAVDGVDFNGGSGSLDFQGSETAKTVTIATTDNTQFEPPKTFHFNLTDASNGASIATSQVVGTIAENDTFNVPPTANPDNASVGICETIYIPVLANDTDSDGDIPLVVVTHGSSSLGQVYPQANGLGFTAGGASGNTSFSYTIQDTRGGQASSTVFVSVTNGPGCN